MLLYQYNKAVGADWTEFREKISLRLAFSALLGCFLRVMFAQVCRTAS